MRDLYPNLEGGNTQADCDDLLEEEPNAEAWKFYNLLKDFKLPITQKFNNFQYFIFDQIASYQKYGLGVMHHLKCYWKCWKRSCYPMHKFFKIILSCK